ncbi:hypothetical protein BO94DRAFT_525818 [Aspergillus sclerotioniger CBS 115572]|uniref:Uncharacterized protein n=1 Tax=Aspergillus sclerotioniger CBS 115572 TaxID=1450535 RepID=A0A317VGT8_9EURO|nr:hypothetical protein BO94DRAFT_525818 [Aspergillus sclerotioniger CBS 115572]PWY72228.1 hypothetical protein BO94DRAFT_525818 [Aspergillus sclerotioniger CBS 115572]
MVALRRFFHAEKSSPASSDDQDAQAGSPGGDDHHASPNIKPSQRMAAENNCQKPEEQGDVTRGRMQSRPLSARSQAPPSRASNRPPERNPRHVDLLDALFSSHRYHIQSASTLSPITPYNEDIAERNMVPFLRGLALKQKAYSRPVSALYQEEVADRNISNSRNNTRSLSRSASARSRATPPRTRQLGSQRYEEDRPLSRAKGTIMPRSYSPESLASVPRSRTDERAGSSREAASQRSNLRSQRSAPDLLSERLSAPQEEASSGSNGYLGVPPAYKQGNNWSNTPLPDSPTLPLSMRHDSSMNEDQSVRNAPSTRSAKKNVRDLSINTKLAARKSPTTKLAHRAIQPPTPSATDAKQAPSIAEVMNSPLPVATPTSVSPLPPFNEKVTEIMDMFKEAFASTQVVTPHPTFETLQDAIVREINSHEAFQRLSFPTEPSLTPSPSQESFDRALHVPLCPSLGLERSLSAKEGQFSKFIGKSSFKKHKRSPDQRESISTSVPLTAFRASGTTSRRRHTDAPLPSIGFLGTGETKQQHIEKPGEQMTYMDLLLKSENSDNISIKQQPYDNPNHSVSTKTNSSHGELEDIGRAPSVLHMCAQASQSRDQTSHSQMSYSEDDSDDEIIQLPSVGEMPQVYLQTVDQNNVTFMTRKKMTPRNTYTLWPRKPTANANTGSTIPSDRVPSRTSSRNGKQF